MNDEHVLYCTEHPASLEDVKKITVVNSPAIRLRKDLAFLLRHSPKPQTALPLEARPMFDQLRESYEQWGGIDVPADKAFKISNVQLPSAWFTEYTLRHTSVLSRSFVALVHFGPGSTDMHIEFCAAATYGCLLDGQKTWTFNLGAHQVATVNQSAGDTVYVPPGYAHSVETTSAGAILVGEIAIVPACLGALVKNMAALQHGVFGGIAIDPEPEAQRLCSYFGVTISNRLLQQGGKWLSSPACWALARHYAVEQGGTDRKDCAGRKKRKRMAPPKRKRD